MLKLGSHLYVQLDLRQGEHDALVRLLEYVQHPTADKGRPEQSCITVASLYASL